MLAKTKDPAAVKLGRRAVSTWHLARDLGGRKTQYVAEAIGVPGYGLQRTNAYHRRDTREEQLKLLAQFILQSMSKKDLRVKGPFEIGMVNEDGTKIFESAELNRYAGEAERIYKSVCKK